jgi:L-ascorbate metabolism protein UlaG (beta-lactamase superfamily)
MGPLEAATAIRLLGTPDVLPIHYATFPALTGTPEAVRDLLGPDSSVNMYTVKPGEALP